MIITMMTKFLTMRADHRRSGTMIMMMLAAIVLLAPTTVAGAAAAGDQTSDALQRPPSQSQSQSDPPSHPHGGRSRAIQYLSAESFEGLKQVAPFIVAVLTVSPASTLAAQSQLDARYQSTLTSWAQIAQKSEKAIEAAADALKKQSEFEANVAYVGLDLYADPSIQKMRGVGVGHIFAVRQGVATTYAGQRSPASLAKWIAALHAPAVEILTDKDRKKQFDDFQWPKMLGYFESDSSPDYKQFARVAMHVQGHIVSSAVLDSNMARASGLRKPGSVVLYKPNEKNTHLSFVGMDEEEAFNSIDDARRQAFMQLHSDNVNEALQINIWNSVVVIAFVRLSTPEGNDLLDLLKVVSRKYGSRSLLDFAQEPGESAEKYLDSQRLRIVWADVDKYSTTVVQQWMSTNHRTAADMTATIGVQSYSQEAVWYPSNGPVTQKSIETWLVSTVRKSVAGVAATIASSTP